MTVLVIDSEGLGAFDEDANHDTRIFLFSLLLSSYFIYNSVGSIDESALQNLSLIVNLSKQIQVKSGQTSIEDISNYFPSFLWILRDFALKLVDSQGNNISTKEYLENSLTPTKGISDSVEAKNRIRRLLTSFFKERDCFALVRPTESEKALQRLDQANDEVFRPEFLEMAQKLRRHIFRKVKVKTLNKSFLNGEMLGQLALTYVQAINQGGVPNIEGAWSSVCNAECLKTIDDCLYDLEKQVKTLSFPMADSEFFATFKDFQDQITRKFKEKAIGDTIFEYVAILKKKIKERKALHLQKNHRIHEEQLAKDMQDWFSDIQEKLRSGEISSLQDFKNLADKLCTKPENSLTIKQKRSEFLLDYSFQVFEFLTRTQSTELSNQIRKISSQLENANEQFSRKKAEFDNEKEYLKKKTEETEREFSNQKGTNAVLNARNEELIKEKKRLEESWEERIAYFKESSNEKFVEMKEKFNKVNSRMTEMESKYPKEIADLQKENSLLKQELEFKTKEIAELKERRTDMEKEFKEIRKKNKSHEEIEKIDENNDWQSEKKFLKNQIDTLKAHIEDNKAIQEALMSALNSKTSENPQHIDKAYETNKHLSFALEKSEENCKKLEQKLQKTKKFQKMVKNCSSLQCKNCNKSQSIANFLKHSSTCEGEIKENSSLLLSISKTTLKESENKPYTEYIISINYNGRILSISRRYKMFCNLHLSLQQQFPHIDLPEIFPVSTNVASKLKIVEERRKNFENYLVQLSQIHVIKDSSTFKKFLGLENDFVSNSRYPESPVHSKRGKSSIELITSRAFSPSRSILSPLTNVFEKFWK